MHKVQSVCDLPKLPLLILAIDLMHLRLWLVNTVSTNGVVSKRRAPYIYICFGLQYDLVCIYILVSLYA